MWVNQRRDFLTWRQGLQGALKVWEANERAPGALLSEIPLQEALGWRRRQRANLSPRELEFIEESQRATRRRGRRTLVMLSLLVGLGVAVFAFTRTARYEIESMMMTPLYDRDRSSAGAMYGAAGMLGWSGSVALLAPESAPLSETDLVPQAVNLVSRGTLRLSRDVDEQTPRQMLLGLLAAGRFAEAEARVQAESSPGRKVCSHAALSVGFSALGNDSDAARHNELSRQLLDVLDEHDYFQLDATTCVLEAAVWRADRETATGLMTRLHERPGIVRNIGLVLYSLARQGWFLEFRSTLPEYADLSAGAALALREYARKASEEDVARLGERLRQPGAEFLRLGWLVTLVREERLDSVLAEGAYNNLDYTLFDPITQLAMRVRGKDGCYEARRAFDPEARGGTTCDVIWPSDDVRKDTKTSPLYVIELVAAALGLAGDIQVWTYRSQAASESERQYWRKGLLQGLIDGARMDLAASEKLDSLTRDWEERPMFLALLAHGPRATQEPDRYYAPLFDGSRTKDFFFQQLRGLAYPPEVSWMRSDDSNWLARERALERTAQRLTDIYRYALTVSPEQSRSWLKEILRWVNSDAESPNTVLVASRALARIGEYALAREVADGLREPADRRSAYASIIATYARNTNPEIDRRLATPLGDLILLPD